MKRGVQVAFGSALFLSFFLLALLSEAQTSSPAGDFSITLERVGCLGTCPDFPEVDITVTLNGQQKSVLEGCSSPGKVLAPAHEIDRISGTKHWVGKVR